MNIPGEGLNGLDSDGPSALAAVVDEREDDVCEATGRGDQFDTEGTKMSKDAQASSASLIPKRSACDSTALVICACMPWRFRRPVASATTRRSEGKEAHLVPPSESLLLVHLREAVHRARVPLLPLRRRDGVRRRVLVRDEAGGRVVDRSSRLQARLGHDVRVGDLIVFVSVDLDIQENGKDVRR